METYWKISFSSLLVQHAMVLGYIGMVMISFRNFPAKYNCWILCPRLWGIHPDRVPLILADNIR